MAHAREADGLECCGLVAARDRVPTRVIRCANASDQPTVRYRIDPREQLAAFRAMEAAGEDLFAIYHSHPASTPYPSATDRAEAFYPDALYVLVTLRSGTPEVSGFRIAADLAGPAKLVTEVELVAV